MSDSRSSKDAPIKTLSIGGATFDLFVRTSNSIIHTCDGKEVFSLPLGEKIRISDVISTAGGGAANTAVGLARLGCQAAFCGVLGNDQWGSALLQNFEKEKVDTKSATIVEEETTSFSLVMSADSGERVILNHPGTARHLLDATFDREAVAAVDAVFLNHIHEESCIIEDDIIEIFATHPKIHLSWNPGGCQIRLGLKEKHNAELVSHTDVLFLNKEEALTFTGAASIKDALHILKEAGAEIVCITDGQEGAFATDGKAIYHCPSIPCEVVDTTGAGDAFGTGVTWALLTGKDLPTALRTGTINAMSVVGVIGAQAGLLTQTHMQSTIDRFPSHVTTESF